MTTLHDLATHRYTEHYARMNPSLHAREMPERVYRNMSLMYGSLVAGLSPGSTVVDVGCGTGFLLHWLARKPGLRAIGIDACATQADLARQAVPLAEIVCGDAVQYFDSQIEQYQGVFCMDMLEHLPAEEDCLRLLSSILISLKPGGFFICRVPNAAHILGSYSRYMDITHHRSFTSHSLRQVLGAAGFRSVSLIPTQSSVLLGKVRLKLEFVFHRALFLLGGYTMESTFTQNVIAVGFK
jgi:2-polyprenyl-3-methyl-5-hydroxy-6-metoxy-1,4-benzoquinol methylase